MSLRFFFSSSVFRFDAFVLLVIVFLSPTTPSSAQQLCPPTNTTQYQLAGWRVIDCRTTNCAYQPFICNAGESCILDCSGTGDDKCYYTTLDCTAADNCIFKCHSDGTSSVDMCRHAGLVCTNGNGFCGIDCYQPPGTAGTAIRVCYHVHQDCNNANPCYYQCVNTQCNYYDPRYCSSNCYQNCQYQPYGTPAWCPGCNNDDTCQPVNYCALATPSSTTTPSSSVTITASASLTRTPSSSPSSSASITASASVTRTPSSSPSSSASITASASVTRTPSSSPSSSASITASASVTRTPSSSSSVTPSVSVTLSNTVTPTSSVTPSLSPTSTATPTQTRTITPSPSTTVSLSRTATISITRTPTISITATATISETPSLGISPEASIYQSTSSSPQPIQTGLTGLTCQGIPCDDDGDLCTVEACFEGRCTHQPVGCDDFDYCTIDKCDSNTGLCYHEPLSDCQNCNSKTSCADCGASSGCSWLECQRADSAANALSNITTIMLNNDTQLMLFYLPKRSAALENVVDIWFKLNDWSAYVIDSVDFVAIGASQNQFSTCLPDESVDTVKKQYEDSGNSVCDVSSDCAAQNQLSAQVGTISTSIGVAGGGAVGCFCGSCIVALVFYRRKKKKEMDPLATAKVESNETRQFQENIGFLSGEGANPLFEG
eukprot:TRINITY_DN3980_c0_g1_i2.p1 TRINITY_DN3980_c0_g1~~TRINITY_DN3980_c0_g1_i2.p1  ORF type:complete len:663 (+),score=97.97 TRINITY_DN3980_c0_g1_i2:121-2109(+)